MEIFDDRFLLYSILSFFFYLDEKDGALVHMRPKSVATDHTTSMESVQEFLSQHAGVQNLALVQCTSVFLRERYLKAACHLFTSADCVFAVQRFI